MRCKAQRSQGAPPLDSCMGAAPAPREEMIYGLRPLTPRGALCPSTPNFYITLRRALRLRPQHSAHLYIKHGRASPSTTNNLSRHFGVRRFYFADGLTKPPSESSLTRCYHIWKVIKLRNNGDGAEMSRCERHRSHLDICAPKPHLRWVPRSAPSPFVPMRSCFGHVNEQHDKACLSTMFLFNLHRGRVFAHACKSRRAK